MTICTDNGKAAIAINHLNNRLSQLKLDCIDNKLDCIDNNNIRVKHIVKGGLHLTENSKNRLPMDFLNKMQTFSWSVEHFNESLHTSHPCLLTD